MIVYWGLYGIMVGAGALICIKAAYSPGFGFDLMIYVLLIMIGAYLGVALS